jgi:hypothetical protein
MIEESGTDPEAGAAAALAAGADQSREIENVDALGADQSREINVMPCDTAADAGPEATTAKSGTVLEAGPTKALVDRTERNTAAAEVPEAAFLKAASAAGAGPEATTAKSGAVLEAGQTRAIAKGHQR